MTLALLSAFNFKHVERGDNVWGGKIIDRTLRVIVFFIGDFDFTWSSNMLPIATFYI